MRWMVAAFFLAITVPGVTAQDGNGARIEGVITGQLSAFLEDDFDRAFRYASPAIQGVFRTPERFGVMVRSGYPMVWRPGEVRFLELREDGGRFGQRVLVIDAAGRGHLLEYDMIRLPDGAWRINGVEILRMPEVGA